MLIMVSRAGLACIDKQLGDGDLAGAGHARNGADAAALAKEVEDFGAISGRKLVHEAIHTASCYIGQAKS
jgi:hypothetical protein